jgi:hypothetical protein
VTNLRSTARLSAAGCALGLLGLAAGCVGNIKGAGGAPPPPGTPTGAAGTPGPTGGGAAGQGPPAPPAPFTPPSDDIMVLPFSVRLAKVAAVAGVQPSDPLMNSLRANRLSLGDYDFANNVQPDKTWTALKVADWVRAMKPICASTQMRARYPSLPESLPALIEAANGRAATAEDTAAITSSAMGLPASPLRYETICLAVLSSLEFVAQ